MKTILHHYNASPFAEKIRLMLGYADMPWLSAVSPIRPPRANLDPLTGGYRRIPVMQQGADLFCDSALIAKELADQTGFHALAPGLLNGEQEQLREHAEQQVFFCVFMGATPWQQIKALVSNAGLFGASGFIKDRVGMLKNSSVKQRKPEQAQALVVEFEAQLQNLLSDKPFLAGAAPSYLDFCAYHPLWAKANFRNSVVGLGYANIEAWATRLASAGHGLVEKVEQTEIFAQAKSEPRVLPESVSDPLLGQQVAVAPDDYGKQEVSGLLVASTQGRWIVARETQDFGTIHVHFPKRGYVALEVNS